MTGENRRQDIVRSLGETPLSATNLAARYGVSRQVIVQDVALLRAEGKEIISTNRGYILAGKARPTRVFKARHTDEQTAEELYLIVDAGGKVEDVFVWHKVYGKICAYMGIDSRRKADEFMAKIAAGVSDVRQSACQQIRERRYRDERARQFRARIPQFHTRGEHKICTHAVAYRREIGKVFSFRKRGERRKTVVEQSGMHLVRARAVIYRIYRLREPPRVQFRRSAV